MVLRSHRAANVHCRYQRELRCRRGVQEESASISLLGISSSTKGPSSMDTTVESLPMDESTAKGDRGGAVAFQPCASYAEVVDSGH